MVSQLTFKALIPLSFTALFLVVAGCSNTNSIPSGPPSMSSETYGAEPAAEYDIDEIRAALAQYEFTPFTLALVGEAESPEGELKLDPNVATDVAFCRNYSAKGMQTRVGSDFWKDSVEYDRKLEQHLVTLVTDPKDVQWLTWQAEDMYAYARDYARNSNNAFAALNFNFGGHSEVCSEFAKSLPPSE